MKASTEEVSNKIPVADNDFEFMAVFWSLWPSEDMGFKNPLCSTAVVVYFFHCTLVQYITAWNNGSRSAEARAESKEIHSQCTKTGRMC